MYNKQKFIEDINRKNTTAWRELYRSFYSSLCNLSFNISKDKNCAEDIVQECFISLWHSDLLFTDIRPLKVYLYRSVYNNTLKYLRDRNVNLRRLENYYQEQDMEEELFYQIIEEEIIRKLRNAIAKLPEQRRRILELSLEGLTVQEIAYQLNISENTVKTQKKRAYAYFKRTLGSYLLLFFFLQQ